MKKLAMVMAALMLMATSAYAKKDCTTEPKDKWMKEADFKAMAEKEGYTIKKFKTPGNCYEIYGMKDGKEVEVYFNPVDGKPVLSK